MAGRTKWTAWSADSAMEVAIFVGLLVLLSVPIVTWRIGAGLHARIEEVVVPVGDQADSLLNYARNARGIAISHFMGVEEPTPSEFTSSEDHYRAIVDRWEQVARKPSRAGDLGSTVGLTWHGGTDSLRRWLTDFGPAYFLDDRSAAGRQRMKRGNELFTVGIRQITSVREAADKRQDELRETILRLNRFEAGIVAPLGVICLLIAAQTWRSLRQLRMSRQRLQLSVRETNHRVKNNLQVVAALLEMEQAESRDDRTRDSLSGIMRQVQSMAAVHDILSRQASGDVIPMDDLLRTVVELASRSAGLDVSITSDSLPLQAKQATALALVANELVLNASKHGAHCSRISLTSRDGTVDMRVEDDGPGFPPGFDADKHANLGIGLVTTLVRHDLRGQIRFPSQGGNRIEISFPASAAAI